MPRSPASHSRSISSPSGTKYAVVSWIDFSATCSSARKRVATSLQPVSDAPRTHIAVVEPGLGLIGEVVVGRVEEHGVGLGPVVEERGPQPVDRGPADAEVRVAPLVLVAGVAVPLVGDADAAGEAGALVDDAAPCGACGG